jgi:hypothetical protein
VVREALFAGHVERLASVLRRADGVEPLREYCRGLFPPGEPKSVDLKPALLPRMLEIVERLRPLWTAPRFRRRRRIEAQYRT